MMFLTSPIIFCQFYEFRWCFQKKIDDFDCVREMIKNITLVQLFKDDKTDEQE